MKENLLYFIWKNNLYCNIDLKTTSKEYLEIIHSGTQNFDSGADFINAKVKINDTIWFGSIEIHIKSSDWNKHKHTKDVNYNSVILHVVLQNDIEIYNSKGNIIPTLILKFPDSIELYYNNLSTSNESIPCSNILPKIDPTFINMWINRMGIERLEYKVKENSEILNSNINNWEETFYKLLLKSFGFKVNSEMFLLLASNLKPKVWLRHQHNLHELESLLFGVAGFLNEEDIEDEYYISLKSEFEYFRVKYNLETLDKNIWKFMRLRPNNFPTVRIAQLAQLLYKNNLLNITLNNIDAIFQQFNNIQASEYWNTHYAFGKLSEKIEAKLLGKDSINIIIINSIIPFLFLYAENLSKTEYLDKALSLMESMPKENNKITREWHALGIGQNNALESQALIHIKKEYCNKKQCLHCIIGKNIISSKYNTTTL